MVRKKLSIESIKRPPMWWFSLLMIMTNFQQSTENSLAKVGAYGHPRPQRRKYRLLYARLAETCLLYKSTYTL